MQESFIKELEKGSKSVLMKKKAINHYINNGNSTIPDLSKELGLSVPTVTKLTTEMCDEGLLIDCGKVETSGGRYPNLYGLNPDAAYFVGVDLRKFDYDIALMDFRGDILKMGTHIPFEAENTKESLDTLCDQIKEFISKLKIDNKKILNICLSISGRINPHQGYSYSMFLLEERPLTEVLEEKLGGYNVSIDNDTRAMTFGEYMKGNVDQEKNILLVNISWGLAVGIIIDGKIYEGKSGFSGEFGHSPAFDNEIMCHCGKKGCLETEASGLAAHRMLLERIEAGASSVLTPKVQAGEPILLSDIIDAVEKEDLLCIDIIEEVGLALGKNIAGLINLFNPELVIIGGTVAQTKDYLIRPIETSVRKYSLNLVNKDSKIVVSKLQDKAGITGACLLARRKIFED